MSDDGKILLARCGVLSECPSVTTDGMTAWVVGVPAPDADGIGEGEAAVSLPLDVLLAAVDAYDRQMRQEHGVGHAVAMEIGERWGRPRLPYDVVKLDPAQAQRIVRELYGDEVTS